MTVLAPVLALLGWTGSAHAAAAFFPDATPPPTQITRDLSLKEAAQRGLITLESKGLGGEGDAVSLTLEHKKVTGPITVSVRVEFAVTAKANPDFKEALGNDISPSRAGPRTGPARATARATGTRSASSSTSSSASRTILRASTTTR